MVTPLLLFIIAKLGAYMGVFWFANLLLNKGNPRSGMTVVVCAVTRFLLGLWSADWFLKPLLDEVPELGLLGPLTAMRMVLWAGVCRVGLRLPWPRSAAVAVAVTLLNFVLDLFANEALLQFGH